MPWAHLLWEVTVCVWEEVVVVEEEVVEGGLCVHYIILCVYNIILYCVCIKLYYLVFCFTLHHVILERLRRQLFADNGPPYKVTLVQTQANLIQNVLHLLLLFHRPIRLHLCV